MNRVERLPTLRSRSPDSHKGDFGRVLVVAGSRGMSGAACLAGVSALRGGAGLVRVATPQSVCNSVAAYEPSYLTHPLPENDAGGMSAAALADLLELAKSNDVVALGPGLGQSTAISQTVTNLLATVRRPTVLDADGINALRGRSEPIDALGSLAILTPHPGEFARLVGTDIETVQAHREEMAVEFSRRHHNVTVLKGHRSVVTDGENTYINTTGNPGMATGGSGDVLTGLIAALVAQGMGPLDAAILGTYVHGLAGDLAACELGQMALIASDIVRFLPAALRTIETEVLHETIVSVTGSPTNFNGLPFR
jgi:ADP-dependent NAD(P)H-hydrate dehydratase